MDFPSTTEPDLRFRADSVFSKEIIYQALWVSRNFRVLGYKCQETLFWRVKSKNICKSIVPLLITIWTRNGRTRHPHFI